MILSDYANVLMMDIFKFPQTTDIFQFPLPPAPFPNEAKFTAWFWWEIRKRWWFWHKISDASIDYKPADAIVWLDWLTCLLEIKHWKEKREVNLFKKLRANQSFWLKRRRKNWWKSLVIYYNQTYHKYYIIVFDEDFTEDSKLFIKQ